MDGRKDDQVKAETTVPLLTGSDFQDPDAYRVNRVIADIYQHIQSVEVKAEEAKQQARRLAKPTALDLRSFLRQDPLAPRDVVLTVDQAEDFSFSLIVQWQDPVDLESVSGYEFSCQYFEYLDSQGGPQPGSAISEEIPLGVVLRADLQQNKAEFGPFPRQSYDSFCIVRVRSISSENTVSSWASSDYEPVYSIARPVAPDLVVLTIVDHDAGSYLSVVEWQMPQDIGGSKDAEVQMRFYSDASGQNPVSEWITLGGADVNDGKLVSGPFSRPYQPVYARARVSTLNLFGVRSSWTESGIALVDQSSGGSDWDNLPPPAALQSIQGNLIYSGDDYGIYIYWIPPAPVGSAVHVDVQCRFWSDSGLTNPITDWYDLASAGINDSGWLAGWWPRADYDSYLKIRGRTRNAKGVTSAWVESPVIFLDRLPVPSQPAHVSVQVLPDSDTHYRVRIFYDTAQQHAVSWNLYVQFYADSGMTDPDGGSVFVGNTTNRNVVPPNSYPYEEFGPWPRNVDPRWVRAGVAAVNRHGRASSVLWSSVAQLVDPVLSPPPPQSVAFTVNEAVDGGVDCFGFTISVTVPSNPGTTEDYEAQARFWLDSDLTQPDSGWITLGYFYPSDPTLTTDRWPKASYNAWAKVRVRSRNVYGVASQWVESSSAQLIPAGSLSLNQSNPATIGEGLQIASGKLKTKVDTGKFSYDGSGQITLASNRDLPVIVYSQPGSSYLGANIVSYNGQIYVWTGSQYRVDTNATQIKQQLQLSGLTAAEFAASYSPVRVLSYVPTVYEGDFIVNTSDRKLYRWNGSAYVRPMPGSDIKAELTLDKLTAAQISAGVINSSHIDTNGLTIRPSAGYPARFQIYDAAGNLIGAIGEYSGFVGLWAVHGRFGGSFSNPIISISNAGAQINNAAIYISTPQGQLELSPSNAMLLTSGGSKAQLFYSHLELSIPGVTTALYGNLKAIFSGGSGARAAIGTEFWSQESTVNVGGTDYIPAIELYALGSSGSIRVGGTTVIDASRNGYLNSLSVGGSVVVDANQYASFQQLSVQGQIRIDTLGRLRWPEVFNENIFLGGITSTKWVPAYDSAGYFIGKIPLI